MTRLIHTLDKFIHTLATYTGSGQVLLGHESSKAVNDVAEAHATAANFSLEAL